jgi:hypothetical protein
VSELTPEEKYLLEAVHYLKRHGDDMPNWFEVQGYFGTRHKMVGSAIPFSFMPNKVAIKALKSLRRKGLLNQVEIDGRTVFYYPKDVKKMVPYLPTPLRLADAVALLDSEDKPHD